MPSLASFPALETLDLSGNQIMLLPVRLVPTLVCLDLSDNLITSLPSPLPHSTPKLKSLFLQGNGLRLLPCSVTSWRHLSSVSLVRNPLLPRRVAAYAYDHKGTQRILQRSKRAFLGHAQAYCLLAIYRFRSSLLSLVGLDVVKIIAALLISASRRGVPKTRNPWRRK